MGKLRPLHLASSDTTDGATQLPPPPPLQPRPVMLGGLLQLQSLTIATAAATAAADFADAEPAEAMEQPLDYSMKRLQQHSPSPSPSPSPTSSSSASSPSSRRLSEQLSPADQVLHRLRHTVLQRHQHQHQLQHQPAATAAAAAYARKPLSLSSSYAAAAVTSSAKAAAVPAAVTSTPADSEVDEKAAYAAECIKSRLDGCGKRVHLFLGILLHFGMPPSRDGRQIFDRVIAFSDEHKNLSDRPTAYFMVLESRLLALIWSKFKGNSSNEYSTLTRAIRSTRQKYKGIFEAVPNPGKKLYKFGPQAVDQFRHLFPQSYTAVVKAESA